MYFLYRHIRPDKNEVFYIGVGKTRPKNKYERAKSKRDRNNYWNNIVNKNPNYKWEIIFESDDKDLIYNKEKEFISLYGRKDIKKGTLVNMTEGGEGLEGYISNMNKFCHMYSLQGKYIKSFNSRTEAAKFINAKSGDISANISGKLKTIKNMVFKDFKCLNIEPVLSRYESSAIKLSTPIIFIKNNKIVKEFATTREAANYFKLSRNTIYNYCKGITKNKNINIKFKYKI